MATLKPPGDFLTLDQIVEALWDRDIERAFHTEDVAKLYPCFECPSCHRTSTRRAGRPIIYAREVITRMVKTGMLEARRDTPGDRRRKTYRVVDGTLRRLGLECVE